jgi:hypothetical protein
MLFNLFSELWIKVNNGIVIYDFLDMSYYFEIQSGNHSLTNGGGVELSSAQFSKSH